MRILVLAVLAAACVDAMHQQWHKMGDTIEEINKNSGVADSLYQGDILLTREQQDEVGARSKRQAMNVPSRRWPDKTVPYILFYHPVEEAKAAFRKAAQLWRDNTCIDIKEYLDPEVTGIKPPRDVLAVVNGYGCVSEVGKPSPGPQTLTLGEGCESVGIAAHEIGHALGFFHTQARHDRDKFIRVNEENIEDGWRRDFEKQDEKTNNNYDLTYDYGSIMHYGSRSPNAAIDDNERVMEAIDGNYTETLGSDIIAFYDILMMNKLYDCLGTCTNNEPACQNDGFAHPRDCSKCICPSGFGGPLCDQKPSKCGEHLEATSDWQTFENTLGTGKEGEEQDEYKRCTYWIKVPDNVINAKIEVKIAELPAQFSKDGCIYAGVEIKAHPDKRRTGYRFCSKDDVGTVLVSNSSVVPVIIYSGSRKEKFSTKLSYRYTLEKN